MKIYTRTGDEGKTALFGGSRVRKDDPRVEAYGTVDELNAQIGFARSLEMAESLALPLCRIQSELFTLGAELACVPEKAAKLSMQLIGSSDIDRLEQEIDEQERHLPELSNFILPAGSPTGAALHVARTVCRRAERRCLELDELRPEILIYLNRLSDHLFVFARRASHLAETVETPWSGRERT